MQRISLDIIGGGSVPLSVSANDPIGLTGDTARIIEAFSPTVDAVRVDGGVEITITDIRGTQKTEIFDAEPYVLTDQDRQGIVDAVLAVYPAAEGVSF